MKERLTGRELYALLGETLWIQLVLKPNLERPLSRAMRCPHVKALFDGAEQMAQLEERVHEACRKGELRAWRSQHDVAFEGCSGALDALLEARAACEYEWRNSHWGLVST